MNKLVISAQKKRSKFIKIWYDFTNECAKTNIQAKQDQVFEMCAKLGCLEVVLKADWFMINWVLNEEGY